VCTPEDSGGWSGFALRSVKARHRLLCHAMRTLRCDQRHPNTKPRRARLAVRVRSHARAEQMGVSGEPAEQTHVCVSGEPPEETHVCVSEKPAEQTHVCVSGEPAEQTHVCVSGEPPEEARVCVSEKPAEQTHVCGSDEPVEQTHVCCRVAPTPPTPEHEIPWEYGRRMGIVPSRPAYTHREEMGTHPVLVAVEHVSGGVRVCEETHMCEETLVCPLPPCTTPPRWTEVFIPSLAWVAMSVDVARSATEFASLTSERIARLMAARARIAETGSCRLVIYEDRAMHSTALALQQIGGGIICHVAREVGGGGGGGAVLFY